jgi:excisionase family DNA binding protein
MIKVADFFYTEAEVSRIFNVNRVTIWRWIRAGKFDSQKIGHEVLIPKWEVEIIQTKRARGKRKRKATAIVS